jgi:hypothetical protein
MGVSRHGSREAEKENRGDGRGGAAGVLGEAGAGGDGGAGGEIERRVDSGREADAALGAGEARAHFRREGEAVLCGELAAGVAGHEGLQLTQGLSGFAVLGRVFPREEAGEVEEEGEESLQPRTHLRRVVARGGMALPLSGGLGCCGIVHDLFLAEGAAEGKEKMVSGEKNLTVRESDRTGRAGGHSSRPVSQIGREGGGNVAHEDERSLDDLAAFDEFELAYWLSVVPAKVVGEII